MPASQTRQDRPGEINGRPQFTREGFEQLQARITDIRERQLPQLRPLLVESERDERDVAEFERLMAEADTLESLIGQADVITIDPVGVDGRVGLGMRVRVEMADETATWVRLVHPEEAFLDEERISATSPLAIALTDARVEHTVWVDAPTGAWPCRVLGIDLAGVTEP